MLENNCKRLYITFFTLRTSESNWTNTVEAAEWKLVQIQIIACARIARIRITSRLNLIRIKKTILNYKKKTEEF